MLRSKSYYAKDRPTKQVRIDEKLHDELRIQAAIERISMKELLDSYIIEGFKRLPNR